MKRKEMLPVVGRGKVGTTIRRKYRGEFSFRVRPLDAASCRFLYPVNGECGTDRGQTQPTR
jgi:hypothetical protein